MKLSSVIKIQNRKVVSTSKLDSLELIEKSINDYTPIIFHGIYLLREIVNLFPKLSNVVWIEPDSIEVKRSTNILTANELYKIMTSFDFSNELTKDCKLTNYNGLVINNLHHKDVYSDIVISNIKHIQTLRKEENVSPLKIILCTYPLPTDFLSQLFENSMIFNLEYDSFAPAIQLECDVQSNIYLECVFKTLYMLFKRKIDGLDPSMKQENLKVLVFLANSNDTKCAYKWLTSRLITILNAYIVQVDNNIEVKKNLNSYASVIVLSSSSDKNVIDQLNLEFDYVIDSGFVSSRKLSADSKSDLLIAEKIDVTETLIRSSFIRNPKGRTIQMYGPDKRVLIGSTMVDLSKHIKIKQDITDFLFCQIALGPKALQSFSANFTYFMSSVKGGLENLIHAGLVVKTDPIVTQPKENGAQSRVAISLADCQLTELGRKCLELRCLDCQKACVLISALANGCFVPCLTLVSLLQVADGLFSDVYSNESSHLEKLREIYDGSDDFEFLITLYRRYVSVIPKEERYMFFKTYSVNKISFHSAFKIRGILKENIPFQYTNSTQQDTVTASFVAAYPYQIAKFVPEKKMYMRPGQIKDGMLIDPYSFAGRKEDPHPFVFYYSAYSINNNTYMKYVSPISEEIWNRFSAL